MRSPSIAIGVFLAALAPSLCLVGYGMLASIGDERIIDSLAFALVALGIAFLISLIPTLALGLPLVLWLRSRDALNWLNVCLGATVISALLVPVVSWVITWSHPFPPPSAFLLGGGLGLASGLAFCVGARPNNSFKPKPLRGSA